MELEITQSNLRVIVRALDHYIVASELDLEQYNEGLYELKRMLIEAKKLFEHFNSAIEEKEESLI